MVKWSYIYILFRRKDFLVLEESQDCASHSGKKKKHCWQTNEHPLSVSHDKHSRRWQKWRWSASSPYISRWLLARLQRHSSPSPHEHPAPPTWPSPPPQCYLQLESRPHDHVHSKPSLQDRLANKTPGLGINEPVLEMAPVLEGAGSDFLPV